MLKVKPAKDGVPVWRIDRPAKTYEYLFRTDGAQGKTIGRMLFRGYTKRPPSMNENGYGFSRYLKPFFYLLRDHFSRIDHILIDSKRASVRKTKKGAQIVISRIAYEAFCSALNSTYVNNAKNLKERTHREAAGLLPGVVKLKTNGPTYRPGTLAEILSARGVSALLSVEDIDEVARIFPELIDRSARLKKSVLRTVLFSDIRKRTSQIELQGLITQYEALLKSKKQLEADWQAFLRQNLLLFNSSYLGTIEKRNIGIDVSMPDFLLIDQFQFVDVFEIKRPDFVCIRFDKSHDNYYWAEETAKAISQAEKYIYELEINSNAIAVRLREKGFDLKIIRPRAFVLIGKREVLTPGAERAFKILNDALKNVQVIFFDDLLETIKSKYTMVRKARK